MTSNAASPVNRQNSLKTLCCCSSGEDEGRSPQPGNNDKRWKTEPQRPDTVEEQPQPTSSDFTDGTICSFEGKIKKMEKTMRSASTKEGLKLKVGIFSRSAESEYQWLITRLESEPFQRIVKLVRPCYIRNNGFQQFSEDVSWCKFGILYHSKNRGRINITDVTDSLYNEELQYLYEKLGKKNVIVAVDDLTDSSDEQINVILGAQPSLGKWAENVFLFTKDEKK
ncbi:uncharacterized protein LOC142656094 [Rhinoderma darwinii]|uniref:uncharacterized protein LOC142656094 n=1 Tax=Rhinoderma darwinii TaxID=43563 RepID=UPI003F6704B1